MRRLDPKARRRVRHVPATANHNKATGLAQLRNFRFHAGGNFRHVGDGIGAQPHRVTRACLLGFLAALSIGAIAADNNGRGQKRQPADDTNDPHIHCPRCWEKPRARGEGSGGARRRRWPARIIACRPAAPRGGGQVHAERWRKYDPELWSSIEQGRMSGWDGRQCAPQAKPPVLLRNSSRTTLSGHGTTVPSTISAVRLSNDICRQNFPSGIA